MSNKNNSKLKLNLFPSPQQNLRKFAVPTVTPPQSLNPVIQVSALCRSPWTSVVYESSTANNIVELKQKDDAPSVQTSIISVYFPSS